VGETEWKHLDPIKKTYKDVTKHFKSGMVQSWNKFCFTGGIIEVDVIFPGDPYIGGLWPAIWLLGNLGRATYEASTNNIWPWSYDKCDRKKQEAQSISACNAQNHFGLNPFQGRGATEIDLIEVMAGKDEGPLISTVPGVSYPYSDLTLQVRLGLLLSLLLSFYYRCCWCGGVLIGKSDYYFHLPHLLTFLLSIIC
jgi:hypothetical protein